MNINLRKIDVIVIIKALACLLTDSDVSEKDKEIGLDLKTYLLHEYEKNLKA